MADSAPEPSDLQALVSLLQDEGYRAQIEPEHNVIRSAAGGLRLSLYLKNESIQTRCILEGKDSHVQLRHVNEFNASYRFGKLYLDGDGDIVLEADFLFDARWDNTSAMVREIMSISEGLISTLRDMLRTAADEAKTGLAESGGPGPVST